jgi:glycosyltransferase involved in cell wall biosynthesis
VILENPQIRVVGHPFGPLGTSRVARCTFESLRAVGADPLLVDVWERPVSDSGLRDRLVGSTTRTFGDVNIFHLNGDEIADAVDHLGGLPRSGRNVVLPMWELPRYPSVWARQLDRFDEVWAASSFIASAIEPQVSVPVVHLPVASEIRMSRLRSRRYFGIPEASYAFLFFFDLRSYVARKNPYGVIEAFTRVLEQRPWARTSLVMKVHGSANAPSAARELSEKIAELGDRAILIDRLLDEDDTHNLIRACDAFVSLHRAEGIGLGLAEAMWLGKPVVGTAYSGNLDFMTAETSHLVPYELVKVPEGAYPHWQDQCWAEPDVDAAAAAMLALLDDPHQGRELGRRAGQHLQKWFSFRACGLRYMAHIENRPQ